MRIHFKNKRLQDFYLTGNKAGIIPSQAKRLKRVLERLDSSFKPSDMKLPGYDWHERHGQEKGTYSVSVSGNWRITYEFKDDHAVNVDYKDDHRGRH
jgi:proteic killer suppression protein